MPMRVSKSRVWLRRTLAVAVPLLVLYVPVGFAEAVSHGPYTRWYNRHKFEQAQAAGLIGQPESAIIPALGTPTAIWRYWSVYRGDQPASGAEPIITYNYAPCFFAPCGLFQVHLRNGRVSGLEQLDD